ncbi:hypothetical protein E8F11_10075 [Pseudomonas sp. BN417]|nr:hypothetical protein [Pseudomonas sp. BN417]
MRPGSSSSERRRTFRQGSPVFPLSNTGFTRAEQLNDKQYWQWGDVQGLDANSRSLGRYTQPGRNASVNLVWEI